MEREFQEKIIKLISFFCSCQYYNFKIHKILNNSVFTICINSHYMYIFNFDGLIVIGYYHVVLLRNNGVYLVNTL